LNNFTEIDNPKVGDNRNYQYPVGSKMVRSEYSPILEMVSHSASVVDFGCGDGSLLALLQKKKSIEGLGIEISLSGVDAARAKGFKILNERIDELRGELGDGQFDYAICNVSLQMVMYPEVTLREMKRVGKSQIISFPNFAYYRNRKDFIFKGRMPRPMLFGYEWYSTGHIHQFSYRDFMETARTLGLRVVRAEYLETPMHGIRGYLTRKFPNFFSMICVVQLEGIN
jgi:methionine biosynthesis protein MetW